MTGTHTNISLINIQPIRIRLREIEIICLMENTWTHYYVEKSGDGRNAT